MPPPRPTVRRVEKHYRIRCNFFFFLYFLYVLCSGKSEHETRIVSIEPEGSRNEAVCVRCVKYYACIRLMSSDPKSRVHNFNILLYCGVCRALYSISVSRITRLLSRDRRLWRSMNTIRQYLFTRYSLCHVKLKKYFDRIKLLTYS